MPQAAKRSCAYPGCGVLVHGGSRCDAHRHVNRFADKRRGTRQERGYGAEWDRLRKQVMERDAGLCQPCARANTVMVAYAVDHKVCKAEGGTDDLTNLEAICRVCHGVKTQVEAARARGASLGGRGAFKV